MKDRKNSKLDTTASWAMPKFLRITTAPNFVGKLAAIFSKKKPMLQYATLLRTSKYSTNTCHCNEHLNKSNKSCLAVLGLDAIFNRHIDLFDLIQMRHLRHLVIPKKQAHRSPKKKDEQLDDFFSPEFWTRHQPFIGDTQRQTEMEKGFQFRLERTITAKIRQKALESPLNWYELA